jgi:transketolase, bacterial and yeast
MIKSLDELTVNTIRILSAQMIQKANSGHPGLPLGAAPAAYTLWAKHMKHNPQNPKWFDRDRFILSAGHGSAMLYSLLFLFGYGLSIDDLKNFRQWESLTPGHPEYKHTIGVEVTTGPLGQGIANAVGMALSESHLAAKFNKPGFDVVNHFTYALCGDGCLMEGVSAEAASLAGTLKLGKLIVLYDSNNITIEGSTDIAFKEDVLKRFEAYGWQTIKVSDGNDLNAISNAISQAKNDLSRPSIIEIKTIIGFGAPNKQGKSCAHGEPLGIDEINAMKENFSWDNTENFYVPQEVLDYMQGIKIAAQENENRWNELFDSYKTNYPNLAKEWIDWHDSNIDLENNEEFWQCEGDLATRLSSEFVLNKLSKLVPNLIGGSADLAPSTKSVMKNREFYSAENPSGSNIHFGIREHAMSAIANGMALHGGLRVYVSGFFVFSDYMKPALRLSALMGLPVINIFTHDSIGVGEDGPTHQPVEQLAALRSIPNFTVIRPCDTNETIAAWCYAMKNLDGPTAIILSRQKLPLLNETGKNALHGAYILRDCDNPQIILMASGSEVSLIYRAYDKLKESGIRARVISMPSFEIFEKQSDEYKENVLPNNIRARLAVEAASSFGWHKYIGLDGDIICVNGFGASAPADILFEKYNFTVDNIINRAKKLVDK